MAYIGDVSCIRIFKMYLVNYLNLKGIEDVLLF